MLPFDRPYIIVLTSVTVDGSHSTGGLLRTKPETDLTAIAIITVILILIIAFLPSNALRIILGLPFIILFPGYTLLAALFPKKADLGGIERVALSLGLSIAIVPLIGLILNYTPWGIRLYPVLVFATLFILVASAVAWYRRHRVPEDERFAVTCNVDLSGWIATSRRDRVLSALLVASILAAIGVVSYVMITPKEGEKFTEFYVLGLQGNATDYPSELAFGEKGRVILGVANHEHEAVEYEVKILIAADEVGTIAPLALNHDEIWEEEVGFTPLEAGDDQKLEFILYRGGEEEPYRSLYLWLDVTNTG